MAQFQGEFVENVVRNSFARIKESNRADSSGPMASSRNAPTRDIQRLICQFSENLSASAA